MSNQKDTGYWLPLYGRSIYFFNFLISNIKCQARKVLVSLAKHHSLKFKPIVGGGGGGGSRGVGSPTSFFSVTSTNEGIRPQIFLIIRYTDIRCQDNS